MSRAQTRLMMGVELRGNEGDEGEVEERSLRAGQRRGHDPDERVDEQSWKRRRRGG